MDVVTTLVARSSAVLLAAVVLLITLLAKKVDDWRTSTFDDDQLIAVDGNVALGIRRSGLFLGGMIAMAGTLSGPSTGLVADLVAVVVFAVASYTALFLARALCHRVVLRGISDDAECARGNVSVGLVEFGIFTATGILLNGVLSGNDPDLWRGLRDFGLYFVLGEAVFVGLAFVFQWLTPFDDQQEILGGNRAVGVEVGGLFVAVAIILRAGLLGPPQGVVADTAGFLVTALVGSVVLLAFQGLVRRVFLPGTDLAESLRRDNLAVALVLQALTLAFALVIASAVA
jgi:uncharacterized membrane protein YjfL (UPF0719 family)